MVCSQDRPCNDRTEQDKINKQISNQTNKLTNTLWIVIWCDVVYMFKKKTLWWTAVLFCFFWPSFFYCNAAGGIEACLCQKCHSKCWTCNQMHLHQVVVEVGDWWFRMASFRRAVEFHALGNLVFNWKKIYRQGTHTDKYFFPTHSFLSLLVSAWFSACLLLLVWYSYSSSSSLSSAPSPVHTQLLVRSKADWHARWTAYPCYCLNMLTNFGVAYSAQIVCVI